MQSVPEDLVQAYRQTIYWCEASNNYLPIRIGESHSQLDKLLAENGIDQWAYITACNPRSNRQTPRQNKSLTEQLASDLDCRGYKYWPGIGIDGSGQWPPEASFLVLGIDREMARSLGEKYEQNAIVIGCREAAAELLLVFDPPETNKSAI